MSKFSLQGLGTPKSASYDNESAYKELLSRMDKGERLTIEVYTDKDCYSSFGIQTGVVSKFKLRLNQDILLKIMQYLTNNETEDVKVEPNDVEPYGEGKDFTMDLFKLMVDNGFKPQTVPLFRAVYGKVKSIFHFPKGRVEFNLERTDELMDYLADKHLL